MENELQDDGRASRRGRLMGKLFKNKDKDPKAISADAVNDFLHAPSDNLHPTIAPPTANLPVLSKLDTRTAPRYPGSVEVGGGPSQQSLPLRPRSKTPPRAPKKNRKGCIVRFVDTPPEVIGEGGDESAIPVIEIMKRKQARPPPSPVAPPASQAPSFRRPSDPPRHDNNDFVPAPIKRTQTGYTPIAPPRHSPNPYPGVPPPRPEKQEVVPGTPARTRYLDVHPNRTDENRRSVLEIHQAEMRQAEGIAFAQAARKDSASSPSPHHGFEETAQPQLNRMQQQSPDEDVPAVRPMSPETQHNTTANRPPSREGPDSPSSVYSGGSQHYQTDLARQPSMAAHASRPPPQAYQPATGAAISSPIAQRNKSVRMPDTMSPIGDGSPIAQRSKSVRMADAMSPVGDGALDTFVARTRHLGELFRLHAETLKPLSTCDMHDLARASLWWFLKGRTGLENNVRGRPNSPQEQMQYEMDRQQAYTNLAKAYWLCEEAVPEVMMNQGLAPDSDVEEVRKVAVYNLRKLAVSMERNGFLPPEEAFLPQTLDKSIWLEYPKLSQDMIALMTGNAAAAITGQATLPSAADALEALPINDTPEVFSFGRLGVDVYLMEQGNESQTFYFPCLLSMTRPRKQVSPVFVIASQNGHVHIRISSNKNAGPTWDQIRWKNETCALEVMLPRGFKIAVQCTQSDYRVLWNMYDFGSKTQATLYPRKDEQCVFRSTIRTFQFFEKDPSARNFPKEAVPSCDVALFEKVHKEKTATGPRSWHRGFRLSVVSGPQTRSMSGINPTWTPQQAIPFGFLRGDSGDPALLLKCDSGRYKGTMVLSFNDENERLKFHTLLTGTAVLHDETSYADVSLKGFSMSRTLNDGAGLPSVNKLPWQMVRVVNDDHGGDDMPPTVYSDKLKIIVDSKVGTIADRVNVETGELRLRLEVNDAKTMSILRRPQNDVTMAVSEAQVGREVPPGMDEALQMLQTAQSVRTYRFSGLKDLHDFQAALTGFKVVYDGLAVALAIARRRMVVPIHKKWEAGWTRIQIVQQDTVIQMLAFFPDFAHGQCMNFVLKQTDVFETLSRSGKFGLRLVDAKFPLPRMPMEGETNTDDGAFVCLDYPDLPGEHDDISLFFEKEADRDRLVQCLPAPVKEGSRLASKIR